MTDGRFILNNYQPFSLHTHLKRIYSAGLRTCKQLIFSGGGKPSCGPAIRVRWPSWFRAQGQEISSFRSMSQ